MSSEKLIGTKTTFEIGIYDFSFVATYSKQTNKK
jgi:hypothetical protein